MEQINKKENTTLLLQQQIEYIADQLCLAVKGEFDFTIDSRTSDETVQKLTMLINFVVDSARRSLLAIKEQNDKLTELDKLKSDFMANISHELRTPLTLILGPLQTILEDASFSVPKKHQKNLERMHRNAARLYVLVNDLLDISKLEAGKFVPVEELIDLGELISQLVDDAKGLAHERKLSLQFSQQNELGLILCDRKMVEKITLNLISNALKFTPEGGRIEILLDKQENTVQLIVTDTGIGISPEQIQHLFERFHQIDSSSTRTYEGTGIGLALVKQFVELMHGTISVESEQGKGSKFTVILPARSSVTKRDKLTRADTQKSGKKAAPSPLKISISQRESREQKTESLHSSQNHEDNPVKGKIPLILVADDNPDMRSYIVSLLEDSYEIVAVDNGKLALDAVYTCHPQVILSDIMMPVMDGLQLTKTLKADPQTKHIPIILITAKAGKEAVVAGLEIGADDYLPKPFSPEELIARTRSALRLYQNYIKNVALNSQLVTAARRAGMADIATNVLHNIGNVLNSVNISISMIDKKIKNSNMSDLIKLANLLHQHQDDIETFFEKDPQGQHVPDYISKLSEKWINEKNYLLEEASKLDGQIQHIKDIIVAETSLSGILGITEEIIVSDTIEDALTLNKISYERAQIEIIRDFASVKKVIVDRVALLQILVNLIKNSIESLLENNTETMQITLRIQNKDDSHFMIQISDNGIGILPENMIKIFSSGFTTKKNGHGFGLHTSAITAEEMGGNLSVESQGIGKGATFTLILPYQPLGIGSYPSYKV